MSIFSCTKTTLQKVMNKPPVTIICFEILNLLIVVATMHDDVIHQMFLLTLWIISVLCPVMS